MSSSRSRRLWLIHRRAFKTEKTMTISRKFNLRVETRVRTAAIRRRRKLCSSLHHSNSCCSSRLFPAEIQSWKRSVVRSVSRRPLPVPAARKTSRITLPGTATSFQRRITKLSTSARFLDMASLVPNLQCATWKNPKTILAWVWKKRSNYLSVTHSRRTLARRPSS